MEHEWRCECGMTLPRWGSTTADGFLRCQECKRTWNQDGTPSPINN